MSHYFSGAHSETRIIHLSIREAKRYLKSAQRVNHEVIPSRVDDPIDLVQALRYRNWIFLASGTCPCFGCWEHEMSELKNLEALEWTQLSLPLTSLKALNPFVIPDHIFRLRIYSTSLVSRNPRRPAPLPITRLLSSIGFKRAPPASGGSLFGTLYIQSVSQTSTATVSLHLAKKLEAAAECGAEPMTFSPTFDC